MSASWNESRAMDTVAVVCQLLALIAAPIAVVGTSIFIFLQSMTSDPTPSTWAPGGLMYNLYCLAGFGSVVPAFLAWIVRSPRLIVALSLWPVAFSTHGLIAFFSA